MTPARKRPEKTSPSPPEGDVKQDPQHTESDFLNDLLKATSNEARSKLRREPPGQPGPPAGRD